MRYPIGFSTLGCPKWPWPKVLEQAAAMGYSSLEIRGIEGDMDLPKRPEFAARRLTDVRKDLAAKELVTADLVGEGRLGLNLVVGWNEGEFEMFGVTQREHAARYDFAQEWLDAVKRAWAEPGEFDFDGQFLKLKGVRAFPKPYGGTRPIIMNAGSSDVGQAFALRNCDAFFVATAGSRTSLEGNAKKVTEIKRAAQNVGREIEVYTVGNLDRPRE